MFLVKQGDSRWGPLSSKERKKEKEKHRTENGHETKEKCIIKTNRYQSISVINIEIVGVGMFVICNKEKVEKKRKKIE